MVCGRARQTYINGDKYEGEWLGDNCHGVGLVRKRTGGLFEGRFKFGQRTGPGKETWGNNINNPFECPMGFKHEGRGFCSYEGDYLDGHFHGSGVFRCVSGRTYEGAWRRGRRHGFGVQVMINDKDRGDVRRHFMGGIDALYRCEMYRGEWDGGQRTGQGMVEYPNGMKLCGELVAGQFEGTVKVVWPRGQGTRLALYRNGGRVAWLPAAATAGVYLGGPSIATDNESVLAEMLGRPRPSGAPKTPKSPNKQLKWGL